MGLIDKVDVVVNGAQDSSKALVEYNTVILKQNIRESRNMLTQQMMSQMNIKYVIKWAYTLAENIVLPKNCIIEFDGGSIKNDKGNSYTLTGDNTILIYSQELEDVVKGVELEGTFIHKNCSVADEEDLTVEHSDLLGINTLKLANRDNTNGMGYIILRKNKSFAEQVTKENTIYEIRYNFDLNGEEITIPNDCILDFKGGSLNNGTIIGNNTYINSNYFNIFTNSIILKGNWRNKFAILDWFYYKENAYSILNSISKLFNKIYIIKDVTLYHSIYINNCSIISKAKVYTKTPINLESNSTYEGGMLYCCTPYNTIRVNGENNIIKNITFNKDSSYPVEDIDCHIAIKHTAKNTIINNCKFGRFALFDILVSGENTLITKCHFTSHKNDTDRENKKTAIKFHYDREQNDEDESAIGGIGAKVINCIFDWHSDNAVDTFTAGKNIIFENNIFNESKEGAIEIKVTYRQFNNQGTSLPSGRYSENIRFVGNIIKSHISITTGVLDGVYEAPPKNAELVYFEQNTFDIVNDSAIFFNNASNIKINNNLFKCNNTDYNNGIFYINSANNIFISNNDFKISSIIIDCRPSSNVKNIIFNNNNVQFKKDLSITGAMILSGDNICIENNIVKSLDGIFIYSFRNKLENLKLYNNVFEDVQYIISPNKNNTCNIDFIDCLGNIFYGNVVSVIENSRIPLNIVIFKNNISYIERRNFRYYYKPSYEIKQIIDDNNYLLISGVLSQNKPTHGTTSERPNVVYAFTNVGDMFFDETLGKPIYWNGTKWIDATGTDV